MAEVSNNSFPKVILVEQSQVPDVPDWIDLAGKQRVYIDSADHHLKRVNEAGAITDIESGSGGGGAAAVSVLERYKNLSSATYGNARKEYQTVAASATETILNYTGGSPGLITKIWFAIKSSGGPDALQESHIKIYYDGHGSADIDAPVDMFFGAEYAGVNGFTSYGSEFIGMNSVYDGTMVSYYVNIPIPFNTGIKVELTNGSGTNSLLLWAEIIYYTGIANNWYDGTKLQVAYGTLTNQTVDTVITLINATGLSAGRLMGVYVAIDSVPNSATPAEAPMEGNFKIYVNGGVSPLYASTGFEDYFGMGFYFAGGSPMYNVFNASNVGPFTGLTYRDGSRKHAYRFHVIDPIYIDTGLKITWNCGDSSQVNFTGGVRVAWCVWYYTS